MRPPHELDDEFEAFRQDEAKRARAFTLLLTALALIGLGLLAWFFFAATARAWGL